MQADGSRAITKDMLHLLKRIRVTTDAQHERLEQPLSRA
jgi:hypothetical protein